MDVRIRVKDSEGIEVRISSRTSIREEASGASPDADDWEDAQRRAEANRIYDDL